MGQQWRAETEEVRAHYKSLAEEIKRKHAEDHPNYQYAPRKPSEKKRRATARRSGNASNNARGLGQNGTPASASTPPVLAPQPNAVTSGTTALNGAITAPSAPMVSSSITGQNNATGNGVGFNIGNGTMSVSLPWATQLATAQASTAIQAAQAAQLMGHQAVRTYNNGFGHQPGNHQFDNLDLDFILDENHHHIHAFFPPTMAPSTTANTTTTTPAATPATTFVASPQAQNNATTANQPVANQPVANQPTANQPAANNIDVELDDYVNM